MTDDEMLKKWLSNKEELKVQLNEDTDLFICDSLGKVFEEINKRINK